MAHLPWPKANNTLNVAFADEPEPLDTYKIAGRQGLILARHIYDGLLYKNLNTDEIVPELAESWKFTGPLTMEFNLRKGVKFHNGTDFTADDVVETLNTVIKPDYGTRYSISVDWIKNVEKLGDYKVRINMSKPFAGASKVLNTACNPAQFGCDQDVMVYDYDPDKARALLKEDGFEMEMAFAAMPRPTAEAIAADLAKVGVKLILNEQQYASGISKWRAKELPAFYSNWGSYGIGDVVFILSNFFGGGADDLVQDPELIAWLKVADTSSDRAVRAENYSLAVKKIAEEAYWMPMYNFNVNYGLSKDLNFTPHPDEFARWWESSWK